MSILLPLFIQRKAQSLSHSRYSANICLLDITGVTPRTQFRSWLVQSWLQSFHVSELQESDQPVRGSDEMMQEKWFSTEERSLSFLPQLLKPTFLTRSFAILLQLVFLAFSLIALLPPSCLTFQPCETMCYAEKELCPKRGLAFAFGSWEVILKSLEYLAWQECLCLPGSLQHTG